MAAVAMRRAALRQTHSQRHSQTDAAWCRYKKRTPILVQGIGVQIDRETLGRVERPNEVLVQRQKRKSKANPNHCPGGEPQIARKRHGKATNLG